MRKNEYHSPFPVVDLRGFFIRMKFFFAVLIASFTLPHTVIAQRQTNDSLTQLSRHRANRAALYSAILPGAGQVYNHKYWKVPILAAGAATLVYYLHFNNSYYQEFKTAYIDRADSDPSTNDNYPNLTLNEIGVRKDYYRRNRDLCYILMGGLYILNIVDAYVDAQLRGFDITDDLSLKFVPEFGAIDNSRPYGGISLKLSLTKP